MEVKMVQCPQCGHYYNAAIHATCPQCGAVGTAASGSGVGHTIGVGGMEYAGQNGVGKTIAVNDRTAEPQGSIGKTIAVNDRQNGGMGNVTIPVPSDNRHEGSFSPTIISPDPYIDVPTAVTEPVVGWLVCIDGAVMGSDFRIHAGYNYIGREIGDIHISGDDQISRQNHAMIAYDSYDHSFYFGPSNGRNIVRVNGKAVLTTVEIHNYDVLTIGTSQLLFVALCGDRFDWSKGVTNGNA